MVRSNGRIFVRRRGRENRSRNLGPAGEAVQLEFEVCHVTRRASHDVRGADARSERQPGSCTAQRHVGVPVFAPSHMQITGSPPPRTRTGGSFGVHGPEGRSATRVSHRHSGPRLGPMSQSQTHPGVAAGACSHTVRKAVQRARGAGRDAAHASSLTSGPAALCISQFHSTLWSECSMQRQVHPSCCASNCLAQTLPSGLQGENGVGRSLVHWFARVVTGPVWLGAPHAASHAPSTTA